MTEKENYFLLLEGKQPEWVPMVTFGSANGPTAMVAPEVFSYHRFRPGEQVDCWGVRHVPVPDAAGAKIPEPGNFILKDVSKWRDVIRLPDLSEYDFEAEAKEQLARIDRKQTAVVYDLSAGFFQLLMEFMGFTDGLCAMLIAPDDVRELLAYISDFTEMVNRKCIHYYEPDLVSIVDDTATWKNPFISVEMYRDLIKPFHWQQAKIGTELGLRSDMHNCGRCEDFIDDWLEMGVISWNPAQTSNDLIGIKKKYGNRLILTGCWDARGELADPDVTEETVKASVRRTIETFAPGGGYMFQGSYLGEIGDEATAKKNRWIAEAYEEFGRPFYQTH